MVSVCTRAGYRKSFGSMQRRSGTAKLGDHRRCLSGLQLHLHSELPSPSSHSLASIGPTGQQSAATSKPTRLLAFQVIRPPITTSVAVSIAPNAATEATTTHTITRTEATGIRARKRSDRPPPPVCTRSDREHPATNPRSQTSRVRIVQPNPEIQQLMGSIPEMKQPPPPPPPRRDVYPKVMLLNILPARSEAVLESLAIIPNEPPVCVMCGSPPRNRKRQSRSRNPHSLILCFRRK